MKRKLLPSLFCGLLCLLQAKAFAQTYNDGAMYLEMWVTYSWVESYDDPVGDDEWNFIWYGADNANIDGQGWRPNNPPQGTNTAGPFPKPNQIAVDYAGAGWVTGTNRMLFSHTFGTAGNTPQTVPQYLMLHGEKWEDDCFSCNSSGFACLGSGCGMGSADRYRYNPNCCTSLCSGCSDDDVYCNATINSTINYRVVAPCSAIDNASPSTGWVGDFFSTSCGSNDMGAEVSVYYTPPIPSSFSAVPAAFCSGGGNTTLNLAGVVYGGTYDIYDESTSSFIATGVSGSTYVVNVPSTRTFRLYTHNGSCRSLSYLTVTVTVGSSLAGGTVGSNETICANGNPAVFTNTVSPSGGAGAFTYQWESQTNCSGGWGAISGATALTYDPPAGLAQTTCYRRVATNTCGSANSNTVTVTTLPAVDFGTITGGGGSFCSTADPGNMTVTPSGGTGSFGYQWYYRDGNNPCPTGSSTAGWTIIAGATASSYDPPAGLTNTRTYAVLVDPTGTPDCGAGTWANNCVAVTIVPPVTVSLSHTDASCAGVYDGTITVTAGGGAPPFSYSLNGGPSQPGNVFSGLSAGTYTVLVTDNAGCSVSAPETVGNSYSVSGTLDSTKNVSCFGANDGAVYVSMTGGIPPYSYSIDGLIFASTPAFTGLTAGNYTVTLKDSKGCTFYLPATISQPQVVTVTVDSTTNSLCAGSATSGIYISVLGGTPNYTYLWSNGAVTEDITNIASGTYNVTVTDANGCIGTVGSSVTQPLPLFVAVAQYNDVLCNRDSTGAIDITVSGGTPPYRFAWSNGSMMEDLANLLIGTYTVTVTDTNGCQRTLAQTITEPAPFVAAVSSTNASCTAGGTATVALSGGVASYAVLWSNGATTTNVSGLVAGGYTVTATDVNGCVRVNAVNITAPAPLTLSVTPVNALCSGGTGGLNLTVTGGSGSPSSYLWAPGGATTPNLTGVPAGTYTVTVTDGGCSATASGTVSQPSPLILSTVASNISCNNAGNGGIDLTVTGGTPNYTYQWNDGTATEDRNTLSQGTYTVTVTDTNNCTAATSAEVRNPAVITISLVAVDPLCNPANGSSSAGRITGAITGGTPNFTYQWSDGISAGLPRNNVNPGTYRLTVTDANGCTGVDSVRIVEPDAMVYNAFVTNVTCNGNCDGTINITSYGGSPPYTYAWSNGASTEDLVSVCSGNNYALTITDRNGCTRISSPLIVSEPPPLQLSLYKTDVTCQGGNTGTVGASVIGGRVPYSYFWTNGNTPFAQQQNNVGGGEYCVEVTDSSGCIARACITVGGQPNVITVVPSVKRPTCFGGTDGTILLDVNGGQSPYAYNWNTSPAQTGSAAMNLGSGTYTVTITDATGCSFTQTHTVDTVPRITVTATAVNLITCQAGADGVIVVTAMNGIPPYMYSLDGVTQESDTFRNIGAGTFAVSVRDANGCEGATTTTINAATGALSVDLTTDKEVVLANQPLQLTATTISDEPIVRYIWNPSNTGFDFSGCVDTVLCPNPKVRLSGTTTIIVTAINERGCATTDTLRIEVENDVVFFFPTVFTPNGDGLNDRFEFDVLGATEADVKIWNRWGEQVYSNPSQPNGFTGVDGWDGTYRGKKAQFDTYTYQIVLTLFDGRKETVAGTITVMQ